MFAPGNRRGFALLEALIAIVIVGLAGVAVVSAFGAELRATHDGDNALIIAALAEEHLARVELLSAEELRHMPDTVARVRFAPPFDDYRATASARAVINELALYDVSVHIESTVGQYTLRTRLFRPSAEARSP